MKPEALQAQLKASLTMFEWDSAANKVCWAMCKSICSEANATQRAAVSEAQAATEAKSAEGTSFSDHIKKFVDNPMSPEEEAKGLRAMLHAGIATGELPSNLLAVLEKTIGVNSGEDDKIEVVDFSTAFPNMHTAKETAMKMIEEQMK